MVSHDEDSSDGGEGADRAALEDLDDESESDPGMHVETSSMICVRRIVKSVQESVCSFREECACGRPAI